MRKPPIFKGHGLAKGNGINSLVRWKEKSIQMDFERTKQRAFILRHAIIQAFCCRACVLGKKMPLIEFGAFMPNAFAINHGRPQICGSM